MQRSIIQNDGILFYPETEIQAVEFVQQSLVLEEGNTCISLPFMGLGWNRTGITWKSAEMKSKLNSLPLHLPSTTICARGGGGGLRACPGTGGFSGCPRRVWDRTITSVVFPHISWFSDRIPPPDSWSSLGKGRYQCVFYHMLPNGAA